MEVDIVSGETEVATKETSFVALIVALDLALEIFEALELYAIIGRHFFNMFELSPEPVYGHMFYIPTHISHFVCQFDLKVRNSRSFDG